MLNIYLARHGQDQDNLLGILNGHRDMPLTDLGREQAEALSQKILSQKIIFDKIYSSPLQRALTTAQLTATKLNQEVEVLDLLIERDFGDMTGKLQSDIQNLDPQTVIKTNTITYFLTPPSAETFLDLIQRAKKLLELLNQKHTTGNILLFSHGDFGKMLFTTYYKLDWKEVLTMFHFGNGDLLLLSSSCTPEKSKVFEQQQYNL